MKIGLISDIHANRPALAAVLADMPPVDDVPEELDDSEWEDELEEAREKADLPELKGSLTEKTIENRDYYYLQWREGDKIRSQYVAPVAPADSS